MLSFSGSLKIFVLVEPCDMRKGFNGLYGMVSTTFGEDPRSGALFVFQQSPAHPDQDPLLGRQRLMGPNQTTGARQLQLATGYRRRERQAKTNS